MTKSVSLATYISMAMPIQYQS